MTTIHKVEKKCAVCGAKHTYTKIGSTTTFGAPDLDTRPQEMKRSTIHRWIQTCFSCGYCAPDISEHIEESLEVLRTDSYQKQLDSLDFPDTANAFLCYAMIQERIGDFKNAGWACIHAAWVCDDIFFDDSSRECRRKAVALLQKAKTAETHDMDMVQPSTCNSSRSTLSNSLISIPILGNIVKKIFGYSSIRLQSMLGWDEEQSQLCSHQINMEDVVMVDLLRRSGQFNSALKLCDEELKKNPEKTLSDIFQFQKILCSRSDESCHTVDEVTEMNEVR